MGYFTILSPSFVNVFFTLVILVITLLAYLLDLKRSANFILIFFLILWLTIPLLNIPYTKATFFRHNLFLPAILTLYYGRGNTNSSFWGNLATGLAGLVSAIYPNKIEFLQKVGSRKARPCPSGVDCEVIWLQNFNIEVYSLKDAPKTSLNYGIHGASHITPLTNLYRKLCQENAKVYPNTVIAAVDPRSSLDHPYPTTLNDVVAGYRHMLSLGFAPERTVIFGDCTGGNLALALCHRLKAAGEPLPGGLVLLSPQTDLTLSGESYVSRYHLDPILGNLTDREDVKKQNTINYAKGEDKTNPFISPLFGDFTGFPPTLIQVGEYEILYDDSVQLFKKMKNAGVPVIFTQYPGMVHDFQLMFAKWVPEVKYAREEIDTFLRKIL